MPQRCSARHRQALLDWAPRPLRSGTYPDNSVNGLTWNAAVNLPIFKTRYISNVQYMAFRQNDPFINDATNGITSLPGPG